MVVLDVSEGVVMFCWESMEGLDGFCYKLVDDNFPLFLAAVKDASLFFLPLVFTDFLLQRMQFELDGLECGTDLVFIYFNFKDRFHFLLETCHRMFLYYYTTVLTMKSVPFWNLHQKQSIYIA